MTLISLIRKWIESGNIAVCLDFGIVVGLTGRKYKQFSKSILATDTVAVFISCNSKMSVNTIEFVCCTYHLHTVKIAQSNVLFSLNFEF